MFAEFAAIARSINVSLPALLNDGVVDPLNFRMLLLVADVGATGVVNVIAEILPPVIVAVAKTLYVSPESGM